MNVQEELKYPSIIFRLKGELYCANSKNIATIMQTPRYETIPTSQDYLAGIFPLRGKMIQMLDLRHYFGHLSLRKERDVFFQMLEDRKQDHIRWVEALERSIKEDTSFTLATDPHKCAFGRWYDSYHSTNNELSFHMRKIDEPHRRLHHLALAVEQCRMETSDPQLRKQKLDELLVKAKEGYMPAILSLLDDLKDIFSTTVYHEMALVLYGHPLALMVDEVLSVEHLPAPAPLPPSRVHTSGCISGVTHSERMDGEILAFSIPNLLESLGVVHQEDTQ